jgi:flavin-dependent dehydrogenase
MRGAELCSECVHAYLATDEPSALQDYDSLWKEAFGRELARAFRIRKVFLSLNDKKMDKALRMFADPDLLSLVQERGDIDYPSSLSTQVLKLAPKLAQFSPQLIESLLK